MASPLDFLTGDVALNDRDKAAVNLFGIAAETKS